MLSYIVHRILIMIPTLIAISIVIFTIINLPPGDYFYRILFHDLVYLHCCVPDRSLFGNSSIQLVGPPLDPARISRVGDSELSYGARSAVLSQCVFRHLDWRADGSAIRRSALELW